MFHWRTGVCQRREQRLLSADIDGSLVIAAPRRSQDGGAGISAPHARRMAR
jgi:hypothetical protein